MNSINIVGRLVRDVEERATRTGKQVLNFSIAVDDFSGGSKQSSFFDVVAFDKPNLVAYLVKGKRVGVSGRLSQSRWENQQGEKRSKVEIIANHIDLLDTYRDEPQKVEAKVIDSGLYDSDIPF